MNFYDKWLRKRTKYIHKTYGEAKTFKTEGDMYEYLTGHRSKPLDDAERKKRNRS